MFKRFLPQILAGIVVFTMVISVSSIAKAVPANGDTIQICHRHNSVTNPYNVENPDKSGDVEGHADHTGPVASSEAVAQALKDNHEKWGDIIPPFDYDDSSFPGLNWTTEGQAIWENGCNYPTEPSPSPSLTPTPTPSCSVTPTPTPSPSETPEFERLSVEALCSGPEGLTRWRIDNPNNVDIEFSWELYLAGGSPIQESGTGEVSANSSTTVETNTPGDVKLVVYWCDPAQLPKECETLHVSATNEDVQLCTTPTPTPSETFHSSRGTKVTPAVLGTSTAQPLPVTGADVNYDWIYYFLIIGSLMLTYYLKVRGWQRIRA